MRKYGYDLIESKISRILASTRFNWSKNGKDRYINGQLYFKSIQDAIDNLEAYLTDREKHNEDFKESLEDIINEP
jgi:ATP-dependent helicase/DNAse subunit B